MLCERCFCGQAEVISLGQQNRHPMMTFSAPRANSVSIEFATSPDRATDGDFLSENVVRTDFPTDHEQQTGRWLDEDQVDPGRFYAMLDAAAPDEAHLVRRRSSGGLEDSSRASALTAGDQAVAPCVAHWYVR
jgi:hypothetical protein